MAANSIGQMEPYELDGGEEWATYIERLEQFFIANKIAEAPRKVAVLLMVIGPKAYGLLRNLLASAKPADKEFDEIVRVMQNYLSPKLLIIAKRLSFIAGIKEKMSQLHST